MSTSSEVTRGQQVTIDYRDFSRELAGRRPRLPRVALLYPVLDKGAPADRVLPHCLYYLYACLKDLGFDVALTAWRVDGVVEPPPEAEVCYVHPMFATLRPCCAALAGVRRARPHGFLVLGNSDQHQHEMCLGGRWARELARSLLDDYPFLDAVFLGRNHEYSLARFALNLAEGRPLAAGLGWAMVRGRGGVEESTVGRAFPIGALPMLSFPDPAPQVVRLRSSVGCRGVCAYCIESGVNAPHPEQRNWHGMAPERFVAEIRHVVDRYDRRFVNIIDSSFEDGEGRGLDRLRRLCELLAEADLGLSLKIHLRSETITALSDGDVDRLKRIGVDVVVLGAESAVAEELRILGKLADAGTSFHAYRRLMEDGRFFIVLGFLMFTPFTTLAMLEEKIAYIERLGRAWDFMVMSNWLLVYWGSRMHQLVQERGLVRSDSDPFTYVRYSFVDPAVEAVAVAMDKAKRRVPAVMALQKLLYDCGNVLARISNPINGHLAAAGERLSRLAASVVTVQRQAACAYGTLLRSLLQDPEMSEQEQTARIDRCLAGIDALRKELEGEFSGALAAIRRQGLDTSALLVDTWFSNVNIFGVGQRAA